MLIVVTKGFFFSWYQKINHSQKYAENKNSAYMRSTNIYSFSDMLPLILDYKSTLSTIWLFLRIITVPYICVTLAFLVSNETVAPSRAKHQQCMLKKMSHIHLLYCKVGVLSLFVIVFVLDGCRKSHSILYDATLRTDRGKKHKKREEEFMILDSRRCFQVTAL